MDATEKKDAAVVKDDAERSVRFEAEERAMARRAALGAVVRYLRPGDILEQRTGKNADGTPRRWRVNGQPRMTVDGWRIPLKHGMRDYEAVYTRGDCVGIYLAFRWQGWLRILQLRRSEAARKARAEAKRRKEIERALFGQDQYVLFAIATRKTGHDEAKMVVRLHGTPANGQHSAAEQIARWFAVTAGGTIRASWATFEEARDYAAAAGMTFLH